MDGNFYGNTQAQPTGISDANYPTVSLFRITPDGGTLTVPFTNALGNVIRPGQLADGSIFYASEHASEVDTDKVNLLVLSGKTPFFNNQQALGNGAYYLGFPTGHPFGDYSYLSDPNYLYHFDLGYEYVIDAADGQAGVYLYDFASKRVLLYEPDLPVPLSV